MNAQKLKEKLNKRLLLTLLLCGICVLISYLETLIPPLSKDLPYAKLTISATIIIFTLYAYGLGESILVMGVSALSTGLIINNNPLMIIYFLIGGLFLVLTAFALKKIDKFGLIAVTTAGLIMQTLGQSVSSSLFLGTSAPFANFPLNAVFSCVSGLISGGLAYLAIRFIPAKCLYSKEELNEKPAKRKK